MQLSLARVATALTMGLVQSTDQSVPVDKAAPLFTLYAAYGTQIIAPLTIGSRSELTLAQSPSSASRFYIGGPYLYAYAPNDPYLGPAHINFVITNVGCERYGALNFSTVVPLICTSSQASPFDGDLLVYSTPGSFELCDRGFGTYINYDTEPRSPLAECKLINILQAPA